MKDCITPPVRLIKNNIGNIKVLILLEEIDKIDTLNSKTAIIN